MKKLVFVLAATLAVAAPTLVRAQGFSIDLGDDGYRDRATTVNTAVCVLNTETTIAAGTVVGTTDMTTVVAIA